MVSMFRLYLSAPGENSLGLGKLALLCTAHLGLSLVLAVITISVTLRLFGKLVRSHVHAGKELAASAALCVQPGSVLEASEHHAQPTVQP